MPDSKKHERAYNLPNYLESNEIQRMVLKEIENSCREIVPCNLTRDKKCKFLRPILRFIFRYHKQENLEISRRKTNENIKEKKREYQEQKKTEIS